jgi:hypothetical protein
VRRRELLLIGVVLGAYMLTRNKTSLPMGTAALGPISPNPGVPTPIAPTAYTALAAPSVGGSPYFPMIGSGAGGGVGVAGASFGGTYGGLGGVNAGQGYGLLPVPNLYGWAGASPTAVYKAAGH